MAHILVIDDTKNIRKMVALTLAQAKHEVEIAEDGEAGLALFGDGSTWDLTLVDQQMPKLEGAGFVVEARRRDPMARIIMITAFATPELAAEVIQSGALDFLRKPFSADELRDAVTLALSQPRRAATDARFDPEPNLARPGEAGYQIPRVSWRMNGYSFWPFAGAPSEAYPPEFELGRLFQVRAPDDRFTSCFVGITPHVRAQIESEIGRAVSDDDASWDKVCGQTLLQFISKRSQTPPDVLPVFQVPGRAGSGGSRGGLVTWGGFFGE